MKTSKELLVQAKIIPRLRLGNKTDHGVVSTGPHTVKMIEDKLMNGKDPQTGDIRPIVRYIFEENGEPRRYDVPVKDKAGELHYLVQRLAEVEEGQEIVLEMKKRGVKNYVDVLTPEGTPIGNAEENLPAPEDEEEVIE